MKSEPETNHLTQRVRQETNLINLIILTPVCVCVCACYLSHTQHTEHGGVERVDALQLHAHFESRSPARERLGLKDRQVRETDGSESEGQTGRSHRRVTLPE